MPDAHRHGSAIWTLPREEGSPPEGGESLYSLFVRGPSRQAHRESGNGLPPPFATEPHPHVGKDAARVVAPMACPKHRSGGGDGAIAEDSHADVLVVQRLDSHVGRLEPGENVRLGDRSPGGIHALKIIGRVTREVGRIAAQLLSNMAANRRFGGIQATENVAVNRSQEQVPHLAGCCPRLPRQAERRRKNADATEYHR